MKEETAEMNAVLELKGVNLGWNQGDKINVKSNKDKELVDNMKILMKKEKLAHAKDKNMLPCRKDVIDDRKTLNNSNGSDEVKKTVEVIETLDVGDYYQNKTQEFTDVSNAEGTNEIGSHYQDRVGAEKKVKKDNRNNENE
ncbi:37321_t:CDS:2, partial [Gigaspora margarita]